MILDEATSSIDVRGERIVQQALDRVSQNRTTIVIAHRLSTIRKADNIVVMRDGRNIEEGTHEHLLSIPDGLYASLVHAQQLESEGASEQIEPERYTFDDVNQEGAGCLTNPDTEAASTAYKQRGFFGSFGRFMYEQRRHWKIYMVILASAMGAGCKKASLYSGEDSTN